MKTIKLQHNIVRKIFFSFLFTSLVLFNSIYLIAQKNPHIHTSYADFDPNISTAKNQFIEDIEYYVNLIDKVHGNPYHRISKEDFLIKSDQIENQVLALTLDSIPLIDCFYFIQELSTLIKDGHTKTKWPGKWDEYIENVFPLLLKSVNDTLLISSDMSNDSIPVNSYLLSINNMPFYEIKQETYKYISASLDHNKDIIWAENLWYLIQTKLKMESPWLIKYEYNGNIFEKSVSGISWQERGERFPRQNLEYSYDKIKVEKEIVPVLKIPSFGYNSLEEYTAFLDKFFKKYYKKKFMIIDIRDNRGGEGVWAQYLLDFFTDSAYEAFYKLDNNMSPEYIEVIKYYLHSYYKSLNIPEDKWNEKQYGSTPYEYFFDQALTAVPNTYKQLREQIHIPHDSPYKFKGQVYLLTSHETFSAGVVFASLFKKNKLGLIIGRETGGKNGFCSDPITMELPNSHLQVTIPVAEFIIQNNDIDRGVVPDIITNFSTKNYIQKEDMDLKKALEIIRIKQN
ncbi:S41 family peptidase [Bacteroidota bacterium]